MELIKKGVALYNKIDRRILKAKMEEDPLARVTLSFYRYFPIPEPRRFRDDLFAQWQDLGVLGRVYVATEGINAQISVPEVHFEAFKSQLYAVPFLDGVRLNIAIDDDGKSFYKLKIKVRKKIVADGLADLEIDFSHRGIGLDARAFNELTDREETVIVDMRNHYESEVGHFQSAVLPDVDTFREALPAVKEMLADKKEHPVVMYCTGGIRCEKASAYLKQNGFKDVYQLEGGIIEYARQVKNTGLENKFIGKNFVFDERLGERITEDIIATCHQCGAPCDTHTNCRNEACNLLFIQCDSCAEKHAGCCSQDCEDFIALPEEKQKVLRKGYKASTRYFKKGRYDLGSQFKLSKREKTH